MGPMMSLCRDLLNLGLKTNFIVFVTGAFSKYPRRYPLVRARQIMQARQYKMMHVYVLMYVKVFDERK